MHWHQSRAIARKVTHTSSLPAVVASSLALIASLSQAQSFQSNDLFKFRSVGAVQLSPDGRTVAYTVTMRDLLGRPYSQLWIMDLASQKAAHFGGEKSAAADPHWSPDGKWLVYSGSDSTQSGLWIAHPDGSNATFLAAVRHSNVPLPGQGASVSWSPDGKQIAFVSATQGPEAARATGDPMVITRYLYRPTASEGLSHFNDNRRLHLFVVDVATKRIRQLTSGIRDEHSIDWSPDGKEILLVSNYDPNADEYFNYDDFAISVADGKIRRITATERAEYAPRWSPDGKRIAYSGTARGLTDRETTMEDTHVWMMDADGSNRRDIGGVIDARQGSPQWAPDGSAVYFTVQQRGSTHLVRLPISPTGVVGQPQVVVNDLGLVGGWSAVGRRGERVRLFSPWQRRATWLNSMPRGRRGRHESSPISTPTCCEGGRSRRWIPSPL